MGHRTQETRERGPGSMAVLALILAGVGVGIWMGIANSNPRDLPLIQFGFEGYLQTIGILAVSVGLLGLALGVLGGRSIGVSLRFAFLVVVGIAVLARDGWSLVASALFAGVIVLHEFFSGKHPAAEESEEGE